MFPSLDFDWTAREVERIVNVPHEDEDGYSELFNVQISYRWRPVIRQNLFDELHQWTTSSNVPSFILIGTI